MRHAPIFETPHISTRPVEPLTHRFGDLVPLGRAFLRLLHAGGLTENLAHDRPNAVRVLEQPEPLGVRGFEGFKQLRERDRLRTLRLSLHGQHVGIGVGIGGDDAAQGIERGHATRAHVGEGGAQPLMGGNLQRHPFFLEVRFPDQLGRRRLAGFLQSIAGALGHPRGGFGPGPPAHCTCDARLDVLDFDRGQRPANGSGNGIDAVAAHLDSPTLVCACGARSHSRARARWAHPQAATAPSQEFGGSTDASRPAVRGDH